MNEAERAQAADIRRELARWNAGGLDYAREAWHEALVWEEPPIFPDAGVHRGRDACIARMGERLALLGEVKLEVLNIEVRGDRAIAEVIAHGEGSASGVPANIREWFVFELAAGQIRRWLEFLERGPAEAAFGSG